MTKLDEMMNQQLDDFRAMLCDACLAKYEATPAEARWSHHDEVFEEVLCGNCKRRLLASELAIPPSDGGRRTP